MSRFFILLALLAATAVSASADWVTTPVAVGTNPLAVAVNPVTNKIYVTNYGNSNVTVIDGATNGTTTVAVGTNPRGVAVNPVTNKIYVANSNDDNVTVIDGATNGTTTVTVRDRPIAVNVNRVTNKIYVANAYSDSVTVIDGATNGTTTVAVGANPQTAVVNPVTNKIYVPNHDGSTVTVIDGATNRTTTVAAGTWTNNLAVNPVTNKIYVVNSGNNNVTVLTEVPYADTRVRTEITRLLGDTTWLARPPLVGKGVNRWTPKPTTRIERVLNRLNTSQRAWDLATITGGSGTDSVTFSYAWGTDSLIKGENYVCALSLESDAAITNNLGLGTPMAGNLLVYPLYRIDRWVGVEWESAEASFADFLSPALPNPSSRGARVSFGLAQSGRVRLGVYDVTGRKVAVLLDGELPAGTHSLIWSAKGASSGVYLFRLQAGSYQAIRQVVLVR